MLEFVYLIILFFIVLLSVGLYLVFRTKLINDCNGGCSGNGQCNKDTNICVCKDQYWGDKCEKKWCHDKCDAHGECVGIGNCKCDDQYNGPDCTIGCSTKNGRGIWDPYVSGCRCTSPKFTGDDCGTLDCLNGGKENGNDCDCPTGFHGDRCQFSGDCVTDTDCSNSQKCIPNRASMSGGYVPDAKKICASVLKEGDMCASGAGMVLGDCPSDTICQYNGSTREYGNVWKCY
jgi:hypothetical protein